MKKEDTMLSITKESLIFLWGLLVELFQNFWLKLLILLIFIHATIFFLSGGQNGEHHNMWFYVIGTIFAFIPSVLGLLRFIVAFGAETLSSPEDEEA